VATDVPRTGRESLQIENWARLVADLRRFAPRRPNVTIRAFVLTGRLDWLTRPAPANGTGGKREVTTSSTPRVSTSAAKKSGDTVMTIDR